MCNLKQRCWLLLTVFSLPLSAPASSFDNWTKRTSGTVANLSAVAYGSGQFVAVGESGMVLQSYDGTNWTIPFSATTTTLMDVTCGAGRYVAVGANGTIVLSTNGLNWNSATSGTTETLNGIAYGLGYFVAVGENGTILVSSDGTNWIASDSGSAISLTSVAFNGSLFVAVGANGTVLTSSAGTNWIGQFSGTTNYFSSVTYGNGNFIATERQFFNSLICASSTGSDWTSRLVLTNVVYLYDIAWGGGYFVLVGDRFVPPCTQPCFLQPAIYFSGDGTNWDVRGKSSYGRFSGVAFGTGTFVIVGETGEILQSDPIPEPPTISTQPQDQILLAGGTASFSVVAEGTIPLQYQWFKADTLVATATEQVFSITNVRDFDAGAYSVVITNTLGSVTSAPAVLTVLDPLGQWHSRNPVPPGNNFLRNIAYGSGMFVAVGWYGTILTSLDGLRWTPRGFDANPYFYGVAYGSGKFVAVGADVPSNKCIWTSTDGFNWSPSATLGNLWNSQVAFLNGLFVAVGDGKLLTSSDGTNWDLQPLAGISDVAFGNGVFVAAGGATFTSSDGSTWISRTPGAPNNPYGLIFGKGLFVAVGGRTIYTSADGVNWIQRLSLSSGSSLFDVTFDGNAFVAVGSFGTGQTAIYTSQNGTNWTSRSSGTMARLYGVTYGNERFIAVGDTILKSNDGISWTNCTVATIEDLHQGTIGNGSLVVVGNNGTILTSSNGIGWTLQNSGTTRALNGVVWGTNTFVAVGDFGKILTSSNGISGWVPRNSGTTLGFSGVQYGNGNFVAYTYGGTIIASPEGASWTLRSSTTNISLEGMTFGTNIFVAVGNSNGSPVIINSADTVVWSRTYVPSTHPIFGVAYGNGRFVAVGGTSDISSGLTTNVSLTSTDGTNWFEHPLATTEIDAVIDVAYGAGKFAAVTIYGMILASSDGVTWVTNSARLDSADVDRVFYANGYFYFLGANGVIFQSDPTSSLPPMIFEQPGDQVIPAGGRGILAVGDYGSSPIFHQWYKDGLPIIGATNAVFDFVNTPLSASGMYYSTVSNFFGLTRSADAVVVVERPRIDAALAAGIVFTVSGAPSRTYQVEFTPELPPGSGWQPLTNITLSKAQQVFSDPQGSGLPQRFYRVLLLP